jgi:hypothetical protein
MPAIVITMNVPPTHIAETMVDKRVVRTAGSATPNAITNWLYAHARRGCRFPSIEEVSTVELAAAVPNNGQIQPNTVGSLIIERAAAGRKVAGMM